MLEKYFIIMRKELKRGGSFLSNALEKYNNEIHLPSYQFCGPNTKVLDRLNKGQRGINKLDRECLQHDLAYLKNKDIKTRHTADAELIRAANKRVFAKDSSIGEKFSAAIVSGLIAAKKKLGWVEIQVERKKGRKKEDFSYQF